MQNNPGQYANESGPIHTVFNLIKNACSYVHAEYFMDCLLRLGFWTRGYKTFFMLNSTEQEILTVHKN